MIDGERLIVGLCMLALALFVAGGMFGLLLLGWRFLLAGGL